MLCSQSRNQPGCFSGRTAQQSMPSAIRSKKDLNLAVERLCISVLRELRNPAPAKVVCWASTAAQERPPVVKDPRRAQEKAQATQPNPPKSPARTQTAQPRSHSTTPQRARRKPSNQRNNGKKFRRKQEADNRTDAERYAPEDPHPLHPCSIKLTV